MAFRQIFVFTLFALGTSACDYQFGSFFSKLPDVALLKFVTVKGYNPSSPKAHAELVAPVVKTISESDVGAAPILTLTTLPLTLQNQGQLAAENITFSVDDPANFFVQGSCDKIGGGRF